MTIRQAYNMWATQYDTNNNKTRDLEAVALRSCLSAIAFDNCLEVGCGTGKNTAWLVTRAKQVTAVDLSEEMLSIAAAKITSDKVQFKQADILSDWTFFTTPYDLVTFSLILEHIENLDPILKKASDVVARGGHIYIGELHPFKQYAGSKARFDTEEGTQVVECYNHHISDFLGPAKKYGMELVELKEFFDEDDRNQIPRILALLLRKP
jgi:ubiquinone/menaquinone biosynthesis C-methylase UbiE